MQRLLYYQFSRLGGKLTKGDVNKDGNDDIFFGGSAGQSGQLFLGKDDAHLKALQHSPGSGLALRRHELIIF